MLGYRLWQVLHGWQRHLERALADLDLTHVQAVLMAMINWLSEAGEPPSQAQLSEAVAFDKMMVSRVVRTLEERGLVSRVPHATDQRANAIALTAAGVDVLEKALPIMIGEQTAFFAPLSSSQREGLATELEILMRTHSLGAALK